MARMVICLAFVPPQRIEIALQDLSDYLPDELQPILDWFEDNDLGRIDRRGNGRRAATFPIEMWNMYLRVLNHEARTNNHAEAANRRIDAELQVQKPVIWKFIDSIKKMQKERDLVQQQLLSGQAPAVKRLKYRQCDDRIERIVNDYANRTTIQYLRGLANSFSTA